MSPPSALDLVDAAIADLESKLNLPPGGDVPASTASGANGRTPIQTERPSTKEGRDEDQTTKTTTKTKKEGKKQHVGHKQGPSKKKKNAPANLDQPDICKLEFKVGVIRKVWVHPDADKLYCEEIDCGEEEPRRIASGLRAYYDEATMLGQRLLVVSNLKPKNLVGFKSFGMVLCAATGSDDGSGERVEFVEPPEGAPIGETVTFEGLPTPEPLSGAQVEKKKVFQTCALGMRTSEDDGVATWNGHAFLTSAGPCRAKTVRGGAMR